MARRAFAELLGTALLVAAVVGSGIAASRLSPGDAGLQLLENSLITAGALVALILALQPVSAAFNPVVTLVERALGAVDTAEAVVLVAAQVVGGVAGAVLANLMFGLSAVSLSTHHRSGGGLWLGEVVATFGLLLVIFGVVRSGRASQVAYAVAGYILAAYWFTSSTSLRQPGGHGRPDVLRLLRRHRARVRGDVRAHAAARRRARVRRDPRPLPRRTDPGGRLAADPTATATRVAV